MPWWTALREVVRACGFDVVRYGRSVPAAPGWETLLRKYGVDLVLDVGANAGQYGGRLRRLGYEGRIVSFEPTRDAYRQLAAASADDAAWTALPLALGDTAETRTIHVSGNSFSSSFMDVLPAHLHAAPASAYVGDETAEVKPLDALFDDLARPGERVFMKIDTQGFEGAVLRGAERSLSRIDTLHIEMALVPLYAGEMPFREMLGFLEGKGYRLVWIEPAFRDPDTQELLQVDGIFRRTAS
jgi:FkbM family methyltransferase